MTQPVASMLLSIASQTGRNASSSDKCGTPHRQSSPPAPSETMLAGVDLHSQICGRSSCSPTMWTTSFGHAVVICRTYDGLLHVAPRSAFFITVLTKIRSFQFRRAVSIALGLALLWLAVAFLRSGTTFHLAPILVAAALPVAVAYDARDQTSMQDLVVASVVGLAIAFVATLILTLADEMTGPSLLPSGGAVTEAVVFSLTGAIGGFVIATLRR